VRIGPRRFWIAVTGIALSALLVLTIAAAFRSAALGVAAYIDQPGADLWIAPAGTDNLIRSSAILPASYADSLRAIAGVAAADPIVRAFVSVRTHRGGVTRQFTLYGVGYRAPDGLGGPPALVEGVPPVKQREVALDRAAAFRSGVGVGDTIWVSGRAARVVGLTSGTNLVVTQFLFANLSTTIAATGYAGQASFIIVRLAPNRDPEILARELTARFPDVSVFDRRTFLGNSQREAAAGYAPLLALVDVLGIGVAAVVVALLIHGIIEDHREEFAILLALGVNTAPLTRAVAWHGARLILVSGVLGVALAIGLGAVLDRVDPVIPVSFGVQDVGLLLAVLGCTGIGAAVIPVLRLRRIDPLEAFRP
jgi:putative ABC transport system permease protein